MATTDTWIGKSTADWGASAANWSVGFPTSNNNVVINTTAILTIGFNGADTYIINSLSVGNDFFDMSGGSLTILATASFADGFTQTGGTLSAGGAVAIGGAGALIGGAAEGKTAFSIAGTIALANYTLGGATVLNNANTTNQTGQVTLGDNTGVGATINNAKGAVFNIGGDFGIGGGAATARFVNAGTVAKTGGNGTSFIDVNLVDTGAITVAGGTLEFRGPADSFAGAISGAGQVTLGAGGHDTIASGATVATAGVAISDNGTLVTLGESLSYAGNFTVANLATLSLAGFTLTLSGTDTFANNSLLDGSGTLVTTSGSDASVNNFTLGGTADWQNSGTIAETAGLTIGDGSAHAATFTNEKGGVYDFTNDRGIALGAAANSSFVNLAGATLEKTGGSGTSQVLTDVAGSGAIAINTGAIELEGPNNSFAGPISGAGQFLLGQGSADLIGAGATITAAIFAISDNNTLVTLGENLSYAHNLILQNAATLDLAAFTLTLSGTDTFANFSLLDGSGTLATTSGSTATVDNITLGGSVEWQNSGVVGEVAGLTIGDGSFDTATFINEKGGVYNFTDDNGIGVGAALDSSLANLAGATLEKTGGGGTSQILTDVADSGVVKINTGTIEFEGSDNSFAGTISGAGQFALGRGSSSTIAGGTTITAKTFGISDGGTLAALGGNLSYAHNFSLENGSALDPGGFTLTLSGTDTFSNNSAVEGSGVLVTAHGGTASVGNFTLGGAANWQNAGTVVELAGLTIGDGSFDAAGFTNESGGIYNFVNDSGIGVGAMPNSSFVNLAGATLEKTGGTGNSQIHADTTTSGLVSVASGTIELVGAVNTVAGTISGAGQLALGGGGSTTIAGGTTIAAKTFGIYDGGTLVTLGENLGYAHNFNLENGSALDLGGFTLTLSGNDSFAGGAAADGSGTLITAKGSVADVNNFTLGGSVNWQNSGTVAALGGLTIGDASFKTATFTNQSGAVYDFVGDGGIGIGASPSSSFINLASATLEKTAGTGDSVIAVPVTNNGAVAAAVGTTEFQGTVGGAGTLAVKPGAVLQFDAGVASGLSVDFTSTAGGDLVLSDSPLFNAAIHGYGGSNTDEIDLRDIDSFSSTVKLGYSGTTTKGVLTVTDGFHTAHLTMFGNYKTANFHASADGFGGTQIFDPPAGHTLLAFGNT